jgi:hypothetical protein
MNYSQLFAVSFVISLIFSSNNGQSTSCTTNDYKYMSTKTDYNLIGNKSNFDTYYMPSMFYIYF